MIKEERCETCNKFTMVGLDEVHCALYFASQWCKCSEEREPLSEETKQAAIQIAKALEPPRSLSKSQFDQEYLGKFVE